MLRRRVVLAVAAAQRGGGGRGATTRCVHCSRRSAASTGPAAAQRQQRPPVAVRVRERLRVREQELQPAETVTVVTRVDDDAATASATTQRPSASARVLPEAPEDGLDGFDNLMVHVPKQVRDILDPQALRPSEMRKLRRSAALVYEDLMGENSGEMDEAMSEQQELLLRSPQPAEYWHGTPPAKRSVQRYNKLIRVQGAHGRLDLALQTFHELATSDRIVPDLQSLTAMFTACAAHGEAGVPFARPAFEQMEADVAAATEQLAATLPPGTPVCIADSNPLLKAEMLAAYTAYMRVLVRAGDVAGAERVVGLATQRGLSPDVVMLTNLLQAHVLQGNTRAAWREWRLMPRRGVAPDAVTYTVMIGMCGRKGEVERAFSLWDQLRQEGVEGTPQLYNTLIDACANRRDYYPEAIRLLDEMEGMGFIPTTRTYESLLHVAARRSDAVGAEKLWSVLTKDGAEPPPGLHAYTTMISAYSAAIKRHARQGVSAAPFTNNASKVWAQMLQNAGVVPDAHALNGYLAVWAHSRRLNRLEQVLGWYEEFGVQKDAVTYNILSAMWSGMKRPERCLGLREEMEAAGVAPHPVTFRAWVTSAARAALRGRESTAPANPKHVRERERYMDVAVALLGEMHEKGILRPPLEPWVIAPPKRRPKRVPIAPGSKLTRTVPRNRLGNSPRSPLGAEPGDPKKGAGTVGESTGEWFRLRTLCYQHPRLRQAFDEPPPKLAIGAE